MKKSKKESAPKCRLCEHNHWSYEPHIFTDVGPVGPKRGRSRDERSSGASSKKVEGKREAGRSSVVDAGASGVDGSGAASVSSERAPDSEACPLCGADHELVSDAERWRALRAKRTKYMRKRRGK